MKRLLLGLLLAAVGTAAAGERSVSLERDFGILRGTLAEPADGAETAVLLIAGADALSKAQPKARKAIVPGMTHPLKKSAYSTLQGQMTTVYANPDLPLDPDFAKAVIAFVSSPEFRRAA